MTKLISPNIRNNILLVVIMLLNVTHLIATPQLLKKNVDYGITDFLPRQERSSSRTRCQRRVKKIVVWRFIITLISRSRCESVLFPHVYVEKLSKNKAYQRFVKKCKQKKQKEFQARLKKFENYLLNQPEMLDKLAKRYFEKISEIKSTHSFRQKVAVSTATAMNRLIRQIHRIYNTYIKTKRSHVSAATLALLLIAILTIACDVEIAFYLTSTLGATAVLGCKKNDTREATENSTNVVSSYQLEADYEWLLNNKYVFYPTILDNVDWSIYNEIGREYKQCYSEFLAKERLKAKKNKTEKCARTQLSAFEIDEIEHHVDASLLELSESELKALDRSWNKKNGGHPFEHDFMPLFKAFMILRFLDVKPSVINVMKTLAGNPLLLVRLNFKKNELPSLRVIYRFDQVMSLYGLWSKATNTSIFQNIKTGVINVADEISLGQDTAHVESCATKGKKKKQCAYCPELANCKEPQVTDNVAGTLVKKKTEYHHAAKVAFANLLKSELCLAFKVFKGNTNDAKTFEPLINEFKKTFPKFDFKYIFVDGIYDEKECFKAAESAYPDAQLLPSRINPRNRKDKKVDHRGIMLVNKRGHAVCINEQKMVYIGRDKNLQSYMWGCPFHHSDITTDRKFTAEQKYNILQQYKYSRDLLGIAKAHGITPKTLDTWNSRMNCAKDKKLDPKGMRGLGDDCPHKDKCCPDSKYGRVFRTKASEYPFLDWNLPQFSHRRKVLIALRLANERIISRLKEDLACDKLYKQNDFNVEAHVAKSVLAQHLFAHTAFRVGQPDGMRRIKTFYSMLN